MKIGVIGAGAWGTALALAFHRKGHEVKVWSYSLEEVKLLHNKREHSARLPGVSLPEEILFTHTAQDLSTCDLFLLVTPAQTVVEVCQELSPIFSQGQPLILCSKGIDLKTERLLSQLILQILPKNPLFVLAGPSFAVEVAHNKITAVTLAGPTVKEAFTLAKELSTDRFRLYASDDLKGAEVGGAFKNVLAIGAGMIEGLGIGRNAHGAFLARGLYEMVQFGSTLGANSKTFYGLSGLGDLILSCTSPLSRNYALGLAIGQTGVSRSVPSFELTEGVYTIKAVYSLAQKAKLDLPLSFGIFEILWNKKDPQAMLRSILARPIRKEMPS